MQLGSDAVVAERVTPNHAVLRGIDRELGDERRFHFGERDAAAGRVEAVSRQAIATAHLGAAETSRCRTNRR